MKRAIETIYWLFVWCMTWIILEYAIYGYCENRIVDNIMTILVIPIIYRATKQSEDTT